jgi:hypothetical protein
LLTGDGLGTAAIVQRTGKSKSVANGNVRSGAWSSWRPSPASRRRGPDPHFVYFF